MPAKGVSPLAVLLRPCWASDWVAVGAASMGGAWSTTGRLSCRQGSAPGPPAQAAGGAAAGGAAAGATWAGAGRVPWVDEGSGLLLGLGMRSSSRVCAKKHILRLQRLPMRQNSVWNLSGCSQNSCTCQHSTQHSRTVVRLVGAGERAEVQQNTISACGQRGLQVPGLGQSDSIPASTHRVTHVAGISPRAAAVLHTRAAGCLDVSS